MLPGSRASLIVTVHIDACLIIDPLVFPGDAGEAGGFYISSKRFLYCEHIQGNPGLTLGKFTASRMGVELFPEKNLLPFLYLMWSMKTMANTLCRILKGH